MKKFGKGALMEVHTEERRDNLVAEEQDKSQ